MEWFQDLDTTQAWSSSSHRTRRSRARAILVELLKDSFDLLVSEGSQQLSDQTPQGVCGDETLTLAIVEPECVLQLPLHGLHVRVLDQEGGTELTELSYLNLTRAVLVDFLEERLQLLLCGTEAHGPHDLAEVVG